MDNIAFRTGYIDTYLQSTALQKHKDKYLKEKTFYMYGNQTLNISPKMIFECFKQNSVDFFSCAADKIIFFYDDCVAEVTSNITLSRFDVFETHQIMSLYYNVTGNYVSCHKKLQEINDFFKPYETKKSATTKWAYLNEKKELEYAQLKVKKITSFHKEMYPFINDVDNYFQNFMNSKSNILVFTGEPGTGKSNLINHFLQLQGISSVIAYDVEAMAKEKLYLNFLKEQEEILILEDSDLILGGRSETGNQTISKILNVSEGIIEGKKFIFTANINSVSEIDSALMRPGRCYDVKFFRKLTFEEAQIAAAAIGKTLNEEKNEYTVAEIYNDDVIISDTIKKRRIGF